VRGIRGGQDEGALDLSVVIVSYNVQHYLAACLESIPAGTDGLSVEVFVVDNDAEAIEVTRRRLERLPGCAPYEFREIAALW